MISFNYREIPAIRYMKELIDKGKIGKVYTVRQMVGGNRIANPYITTESHFYPQQWWRHRLPGLGSIDWNRIIANLDEIGYFTLSFWGQHLKFYILRIIMTVN
jgi:sugar phosphate isomerase/epimerase